MSRLDLRNHRWSCRHTCVSPQRGEHRGGPRRHVHAQLGAVAKSPHNFIHYNQAAGRDAWQGLPRDYNTFTPLGSHHMGDQIGVTGDQRAAPPPPWPRIPP